VQLGLCVCVKKYDVSMKALSGNMYIDQLNKFYRSS